MTGIDESIAFQPVRIAVMTVSDSRTPETDKSGDRLVDGIAAAGHVLAERKIVADDVDTVTAQLKTWIGNADIDVVIATGGTGLTGRDITPEAFEALYDKPIPGFGELFRMLSYETIGTSTIQSRATGGLAGGTLLFALPGSPGAVKDGWEKILKYQLDNRLKPCNLVELMPRFFES